jgi:hypothetical protein
MEPIGHLVQFAATSNRVVWTRQHQARRIRHLVTEQFGLPPGEYLEDGEFIRDFGAR